MLTYLRKGFLRRYIRMNAFRRGLLGGETVEQAGPAGSLQRLLAAAAAG